MTTRYPPHRFAVAPMIDWTAEKQAGHLSQALCGPDAVACRTGRRTALRLAAVAGAVLVLTPIVASAAAPLPVCTGGDRAERRLTCIVDGDTGYERGVKWRIEAIDAPEISDPECRREKALGIKARDRLSALMGDGYTIKLGKLDRYKRPLAVIHLADGRDAGDVLRSEGLAQPWPNRGNRWCER